MKERSIKRKTAKTNERQEEGGGGGGMMCGGIEIWAATSLSWHCQMGLWFLIPNPPLVRPSSQVSVSIPSSFFIWDIHHPCEDSFWSTTLRFYFCGLFLHPPSPMCNPELSFSSIRTFHTSLSLEGLKRKKKT